MIEVSCFACHKVNTVFDKVGYRAECDCGADLHSCKNCQFYDAKAYNSCREPTAEFIQEKERANYCDHYKPRAKAGAGPAGPAKDDLRAKAEALFKKK